MNGKMQLLNLIIYFSCLQNTLAGRPPATDPLNQLQAPALGITSTTTVLLWEDAFTPDFQPQETRQAARIYHIYQNGKKIGSTDKKTFTVKNLLPGTNYRFQVALPKAGTNGRWNELKVTTLEVPAYVSGNFLKLHNKFLL